VKRGLFSTALGNQAAFGSSVKFDRQYWLVGEIVHLHQHLVALMFGVRTARDACGERTDLAK
jgi:hypothetical protein